MGGFGTVPLKQVWAMLDACAPGHTRDAKTHNWCIRYADKVFPALPLGPHGKRENPAIELGHIKKMVRTLGIADCARKHLEQL